MFEITTELKTIMLDLGELKREIDKKPDTVLYYKIAGIWDNFMTYYNDKNSNYAEDLIDKIKKLEDELEAFDGRHPDDYGNLEYERDDLQMELEDMTYDYNTVQKENDELSEETSRLENEVEDLKEEIKTITNDNDDLNHKLNKFYPIG